MAESMIVTASRCVVRVEGEHRLKALIDSGIWDYYLCGTNIDDLGRQRYFVYMELKRCRKLRQLAMKYSCLFTKLMATRTCVIEMIKTTMQGWTECGDLKVSGGERLREIWEQGRKNYANGDYENIPQWLLKELNKLVSKVD